MFRRTNSFDNCCCFHGDWLSRASYDRDPYIALTEDITQRIPHTFSYLQVETLLSASAIPPPFGKLPFPQTCEVVPEELGPLWVSAPTNAEAACDVASRRFKWRQRWVAVVRGGSTRSV